jgi:hypothetical protein
MVSLSEPVETLTEQQQQAGAELCQAQFMLVIAKSAVVGCHRLSFLLKAYMVYMVYPLGFTVKIVNFK